MIAGTHGPNMDHGHTWTTTVVLMNRMALDILVVHKLKTKHPPFSFPVLQTFYTSCNSLAISKLGCDDPSLLCMFLAHLQRPTSSAQWMLNKPHLFEVIHVLGEGNTAQYGICLRLMRTIGVQGKLWNSFQFRSFKKRNVPAFLKRAFNGFTIEHAMSQLGNGSNFMTSVIYTNLSPLIGKLQSGWEAALNIWKPSEKGKEARSENETYYY